jgi:competence protein ComEC
VTVASVALGAGLVGIQQPGRTADVLESASRVADSVRLQVRVERTPQRIGGGSSDALGAGFAGGAQNDSRWSWRGTTVGDPTGVPVTVQMSASEQKARGLAFGAVVELSGKPRRDEAGEATSYTLRADRGSIVIVRPPPPWLAWTVGLRSAFAAAAGDTPGDGGALLPGLAIGDETAISPELDQAMKASSLSHLTAVSGANCALVIALVFGLARLGGLGRRWRIGAAGIALLGFVILVGPGASVVRAATMAAVVLLGLARGRPADGLPALSLAVVVLLVHDPWLARDYGFALSVFATAGLLLLAAPLARALSRWMPRSVALALAVPTAAQLACQPVLLLLSPTLPLLGIPANLLAEPAAPIATVLGCLACALLPVAPGLGSLVVHIAWIPSAWIAQVATVASQVPGVSLPWAPGVLGVLLSTLLLAAVSVVLLGRRAPRAVAVTAVLGLCAGGLVYAGSLGGTVVGRALAIPVDWQIAACDVGQGDGLLLRDGDATAMIDVGREPEPAGACLERLGVDRLDFLLLTHYDADHVGGIAAVAAKADRAIVQRPVRAADRRTLAVLAAAGVPVEEGRAGMSGRLGELSWRLLWPRFGAGETEPDTGVGNPGSITLEAEGHGLRSIFLGDLGEEAQDAVVATGAVRPVDVVKVAHHGSADQSARLYQALGARLGLVSAGAHNGYGHPTKRALGILADAATTAARTDQLGMLLVSPSGQPGPDGRAGVRLWTERTVPATPAAESAGGRLYPGYERGGTWRPEAAAEPAQARAAPRPARSRRWPGIRSGPLRWSWFQGRKASSPIGRSACSAMASKQKTPALRSATCTPATTLPASCSPSRAPPCSENRASFGSTRSRSATTRSWPTCSTTSAPRRTARSSRSGTRAACEARSCSTRSGRVPEAASRWSAPS